MVIFSSGGGVFFRGALGDALTRGLLGSTDDVAELGRSMLRPYWRWGCDPA
jgi:hypothetical protein